MRKPELIGQEDSKKWRYLKNAEVYWSPDEEGFVVQCPTCDNNEIYLIDDMKYGDEMDLVGMCEECQTTIEMEAEMDIRVRNARGRQVTW